MTWRPLCTNCHDLPASPDFDNEVCDYCGPDRAARRNKLRDPAAAGRGRL